MPILTGTEGIIVNSFFKGVEYLLSPISDEEIRREAVRTIYYSNIQEEAKSIVINHPEPNNWRQIKTTLKLRYRPDTEPHQTYRRIASLRANNISELAIDIQNIKYK